MRVIKFIEDGSGYPMCVEARSRSCSVVVLRSHILSCNRLLQQSVAVHAHVHEPRVHCAGVGLGPGRCLLLCGAYPALKELYLS